MKLKKIKRICAVLVCTLFTTACLAGCGSSSSSESAKSGKQEVTFNLGTDPKTIDPSLNQAVDGSILIVNMFEGLYKLDENDNPVPGMAESYDVSSDKTVYTFHLRNDIKWSNGEDVKAGDFEYSWKRVIAPETAAEYAYQMMYLKGAEEYNTGKGSADNVGVKAIDDKTLQVTLKEPCPYFISLTTFPSYFPLNKAVVENNSNWTENPETYISNGKFKLTDYKIKDGCTLEKNDEYYGKDDVTLDKLNVKFATEDTSSWANLKTGQFDIIYTVPKSEVQGGVKEGLVNIFPQLGTYYYTVNVSDEVKNIDPDAAKVLQNEKVRKALNLAVDRESIINNVTKGEQVPATSFVPDKVKDGNGEDFHQKDYFPAKGDVDEAKKLLSEAGYPDGQGFPSIVLLYNPESGHGDIAQAVQDMWKTNLGIDVKLQSQEWKVFQQTRNHQKFELARNGWVADYSDPMTFLDLLQSKSGLDDGKYNNAKYDSLVAKAKSETDTAKRSELLHQAEDQLMEDMPVIPIYYYTQPIGVGKNIKGLRGSTLGYFFFDKVTKGN